jgi:hypothetical protein
MLCNLSKHNTTYTIQIQTLRLALRIQSEFVAKISGPSRVGLVHHRGFPQAFDLGGRYAIRFGDGQLHQGRFHSLLLFSSRQGQWIDPSVGYYMRMGRRVAGKKRCAESGGGEDRGKLLGFHYAMCLSARATASVVYHGKLFHR